MTGVSEEQRAKNINELGKLYPEAYVQCIGCKHLEVNTKYGTRRRNLWEFLTGKENPPSYAALWMGKCHSPNRSKSANESTSEAGEEFYKWCMGYNWEKK